MKVARLACGLLLVLPVWVAQAEVYRYIDKNGNQVFTDSPPQGAEKVPQGPVMTMPFPKAATTRRPEAEEVKKPVTTGAYVVTLSAPEADSVFRRGEGEVPVAVSVSPALTEGQQLQVLLDGKKWDGGGIPLDETLDRGTHIIEARVMNDKGGVLSSASVRFHVQQTIAPTPKAKPKAKP
jgi:hypothetical protein